MQLSPNQLKMLSEGHTILVEDMKRTNGELFSAFVTLDSVTGKPNYTRSNPETGEIYIPKEISQTPLTPEDRETLRKGGTVFLENMANLETFERQAAKVSSESRPAKTAQKKNQKKPGKSGKKWRGC